MQQLFADIKYFILQTLAYPPIKSTAAAVGALLGTSIIPHVEMLTGLALLFTLDWCFGVWNAWKAHRLSSAGMRRGITKATVYAGFIAATAMVEYLITGTKWLTAGVIGIALLTELMSISEHAVALGIEFAGAEKIREWSRAKLALYGVIYEDKVATDSIECKNARELLVKQVPMINDGKLREAAAVYLQEWYHWMCSLRAVDLDGDLQTALSRMRHEIHYVVFNINMNMLKAGLDQKFVQMLLNEWLGDLVSRMELRARYIISNSDDLSPALRCRAVRAVVLYHLDRFVFGVRELEQAAGNLTPASLLPAIQPLADDSSSRIRPAQAQGPDFEPTEATTTPPPVKDSDTTRKITAGDTTQKILAGFRRLNETTKTPLPHSLPPEAIHDDPERRGIFPPAK